MKPPKLTPVKSEHLQAIGYDDRGLFVHFNGGELYSYPKAPRALFDEGLKAKSPGTWFREKVRSLDHVKHGDGKSNAR